MLVLTQQGRRVLRQLFFKPLLYGCFLLVGLFPRTVQEYYERLNQSTIHLPVTYSEEELQRSLNRYYLEDQKGIFCEDNSFTNYDNDHLKSLCRQKSEISVKVRNEMVITSVPIQIDVTYLIDEEFNLNLGFYEKAFNINWEKDLTFDILVSFETRVYIDKDSNIRPHTVWSFEWQTYPNVSFGIFSFRITDVAEKAIARTLEEFAKDRIDKTIKENIVIKNIINTAWDLTSAPFQVNKRWDVWALIKPEEIRSGQISLRNGNIHFYFESDFFGFLNFGFQDLIPLITLKKTNKLNLPPPIPTAEKTNSFFVDFTMDINSEKLENLMSEILSKKDIVVGTGAQKFAIREIYIKKINRFIESDVYMKNLDPSDPVKQYRMSLKFIPYYSAKEKKIKIRNLTYKIDTDSHIVNLGSVLFNKALQSELERNIGISSDSFLQEIHTNLNQDLKRTEIDSQKILNMQINSLVLNNVETSRSTVIVYLTAEGRAKLQLVNLF